MKLRLSVFDVYTVDSGIFGLSFPMVYITYGINFCFAVCLDFIFFLIGRYKQDF